VPVPSQDCEHSCICVLEVPILPISTIILFDFGTVPTLWYVFPVIYFTHTLIPVLTFILTVI